MSNSETNQISDREVVSVTKHGQATIPKRFRDKLGLDAPGMVQFRETNDGAVVVERVRSPREMRGFSATHESTTDEPATSILHEKREQDREARDSQFGEDDA